MNTEAARVFSRLILPERTVRIKLLGDSITHGMGGTGFAQNGEVFTSGFARNPDGFCWANLFRDELESCYDCKVINNAISGARIELILERFDELVDEEDDIVLCAVGTNNRSYAFASGPKPSKTEYMKRFYEKIITLNDLLRKAGKEAVFCANIPASKSNEQDGTDYWRVFHMDDVHDIFLKASYTCGFPLISLFREFSEYCISNGITIDSLLADGLHPNDAGYRVIFSIIMKELGLGCKI